MLDNVLKDDNYFVIKGWMINQLGLKGTDLAIYAIIYGFSQDGVSEFSAGVRYLADFASCNVRTAQRSLKDLTDRNLLIKTEYIFNNVILNKYRINREYVANVAPGDKMSPPPDKMSQFQKEKAPPTPPEKEKKINNNIKNTIPCDILDKITAEWNCLGVTPIREIKPDSQRYSHLRERINEYGADTVFEALGNIQASDFLLGHNKKGWQITFDWFVNKANFLKVLEGTYSNRKSGFYDELERMYQEELLKEQSDGMPL